MKTATAPAAPRAGKTRREEYSDATRQALLDAARALFTKAGYQTTSIEQICNAARVTKGALYHHFPDKRAVFDALVVQLQMEAAAFVESRARAGRESDVVKRMETGFDAYLTACSGPAYRRIVIIEGATVLGLTRFREIAEANMQRLLGAPLSALLKGAPLAKDDLLTVSQLVAAMMFEAATLLPEARKSSRFRKVALDFVMKSINSMVAPQGKRVKGLQADK